MSDKLPIGLAKKLQQMLQGKTFPQSALKGSIVRRMIDLGIFVRQVKGRGIRYTAVPDYLRQYLSNELGIQDLGNYIDALEQPGSTKSQNALVSGSSKTSSVAVAQGFAVKTHKELPVYWKGEERRLNHWEGTAIWIQSPEDLQLLPNTTIVCIENVDSFNRIQQQAHRFPPDSIYISRYYSDGQALKRWLSKQRGAAYIHFGDFDLSALQIYVSEFRPYIEKHEVSYYTPPHLLGLLQEHGSSALYFKQLAHCNHSTLASTPEIAHLYQMLTTEQKALEQEILWELG